MTERSSCAVVCFSCSGEYFQTYSMPGKDKATNSLRKENSNLRSEIDSLKTHVLRLVERLREKQAAKGNLESSLLSSEEAKTLEFVSGQSDDMSSLHDKTLKELKSISERLSSISNRCEEIKNYIDNAEDNSYQVKLVRICIRYNISANLHITTARARIQK